MKKWASSIGALFGLVAGIVAALEYFATEEELEVVISKVEATQRQVTANRDELQYQSALRTYEFLVKKREQYPEDRDIQKKVAEAEKRLKQLECKIFQLCE